MSRARKLLGSALVAALSVRTVGASGESATGDEKALCAGQPGGLPSTVTQWAEGARLFGGLGDFHRAVNTHSPEAQAYFDQGMRLSWAFNHDEARVPSPKPRSSIRNARCAGGAWHSLWARTTTCR
jgi:hypothetical protein